MSKNTDKIDSLTKRISEVVDKEIDANASRSLGELMADRIRKRTRLGYGVSNSESQQPLKKLTEGYVSKRERYRQELHPNTRPNRSNLTATGQMLDGIEAKGQKGKVILEISGSRNRELGGRRSTLTNAEVAKYVQEQGRKFFAATNAEKQFLVREVKKLILSGLRKN